MGKKDYLEDYYLKKILNATGVVKGSRGENSLLWVMRKSGSL